jgi:serine/threonine protein kinase
MNNGDFIMIYCLSCCNKNDDKAKICNSCFSSLECCPRDKIKKDIILSDRYKLISPLQKGGMGELYAALDQRLNCICAVKLLYFDSLSDEEKDYRVTRFKSEVEILARLRHPALPHVLDYFIEDDKYYLVMDYIPGNDLLTIMERERKRSLEEERVITWALTLCDVLNYLHSNKPQIIYRDLKPDNVMLRARDNQIILIDFGTAKATDRQTRRQTAIGTVGYAPPEQYSGIQDVRSDIYSLGATIYHLVTGTMPVMPFEFKPVRRVNSSVSTKLEAVLIKALKKDLEDRYQTAKELKSDLMSVISMEEEKPVVIRPPKEEKLDLLGRIKKNIVDSLNKLKREFYTQKKIKIFIVEGSATQTLSYIKTIEMSGDMEIIASVSTGEECLEKLAKSQDRPDIILMDITVSDKNSIGIISKIKGTMPSAKIIVLSSHDLDRETVLNSLRAGVAGYILKKDSHENILEGIRKASQGGTPIESEVVTYLLDEFVNKTREPKEAELTGFDGFELEILDLFDLLVEFCSCGVTGKLSIKSPLENGDIYVEDGDITNCIYGQITGEEAFYQSVNWVMGKGRFYAGETPEKRTINTPTDELLTEVLKRKEQFVKIREVVKSPDDIFKVQLSTSAIVTVQSEYLYILFHLDEKKTVRDVMTGTGKTYFDIGKAIYELVGAGMVKKVQ